MDDNELSARPIRQLSEEELGQTWNAIYLIENYLAGFDAYIWRAVEDLFHITEEARNQYAEKGGSLSPGPIVSELELRIIKVCTTVKMYAEHVEVRLGRLYGKESSELREVSTLLSALYDSSLPYRVSNHLRNALVHGSPAELLVATSNSQRSDSGEKTATVDVHLSREGFQSTRKMRRCATRSSHCQKSWNYCPLLFKRQRVQWRSTKSMHLLSPAAAQAADWLAKLFKEASTVLVEDEWPGFLEVHPDAAEGSKI